jgi:hypothetical protein
MALRIYFAGIPDADFLAECAGEPMLIVTGSKDDIRAAAKMMFEDVEIVIAPPTESEVA